MHTFYNPHALRTLDTHVVTFAHKGFGDVFLLLPLRCGMLSRGHAISLRDAVCLVHLALCLPFTTSEDLLHLLFYQRIISLRINLAHLFTKFRHLFAQTLGCLFLGLCLTYLAYGVLYASVSFLYQLLRLLFGTAKYSLALLVNLLQALLVAWDGSLYVLLTLVHRLSFLLPVPLVAHYVLQVFVALDVVLSHNL